MPWHPAREAVASSGPIANPLGYAGPSAFAAMFKKRFGQLPSQFFH